MDVLFAFVGDGYVFVCADTSTAQSIIVQRMNYDKLLQLDSHKIMVRENGSALRPSLEMHYGLHPLASVRMWKLVSRCFARVLHLGLRFESV